MAENLVIPQSLFIPPDFDRLTDFERARTSDQANSRSEGMLKCNEGKLEV
jgi:hypothetical protein